MFIQFTDEVKMKKKLFSLLLSLGLGIIISGGHKAMAADYNDSFRHRCDSNHSRGLQSLSMFPFYSEKCNDPEKFKVHFVVLGGVLGGFTLEQFSHFTRPGEGLALNCIKKGSTRATTIHLTTDQNPSYNQTSTDSQYPIWQCIAHLPVGCYTATLHVTSNFEKNVMPYTEAKLTQSFKVCQEHNLVIFAQAGV